MSDVRSPWFYCFVMAQRVILGAMGNKKGTDGVNIQTDDF